MKTKFNSDDDLPLQKLLELLNIIAIVKVALHEDNKYYPHAFSDVCLYKL